MLKRFPIKTLADGRAMLNVGCGSKMNWQWNNVDFSPLIFFVKHPRLSALLNKLGLLSTDRYKRIFQVDPEIVNYDLRYGLPYDDESFDVVYHSHFLEHLDRETAQSLLKECWRCLKKNGVLRIVVPDLSFLVNCYNSTFLELEKDNSFPIEKHHQSIELLFDQMIVQEPAGTKIQSPLMRFIEKSLRGNSAQAGELHQWMYDRYSLTALLGNIGFKDIQVETFQTSKIQGWQNFGLDNTQDGGEYRLYSLYIEGIKA